MTETLTADNLIPPITDPLGRGWEQPDRKQIILNGTVAEMGKRTFDSLLEYSSSIPSGVYIGKMWKAKTDEGWLLRWYGKSDKGEDYCSINSLLIEIKP